MGKRLLKYILNNPSTSVSVIEKRYMMIDNFIKSDNIDKFDKILNEIIDFERMHRRMSLNVLHPYEFLNLTYSYGNILDLIDLVKNNLVLEDYNLDQDIIDNFKEYIDNYEQIFDLKEMGKYGLLNIYGSFFRKNNYIEIDEFGKQTDKRYVPVSHKNCLIRLASSVPFPHSSVMIRKSFLSKLFSDNLEEFKKLSKITKKMGNSMTTAMNNYIKKED